MEERILSKEEVEMLLKVVPKKKGAPLEEEKEKKVSEYDFRCYSGIPREHFPIFKCVHEQFVFLLSKSLRERTGKLVKVVPAEPEVKRLGEFLTSCPNPSYIVVFMLEPVLGEIFFAIEPATVHALVDIALGGDGKIIASPPEITLIERDIIPRSSKEILDDLTNAWRELTDVQIKIVADGINPLTAGPSESPAPVLVAGFEIKYEEGSEFPMLMWLAYSADSARDLGARGMMGDRKKYHPGEGTEFRKEVSEILKLNEIEVFAELGRTSFTIRDLIELEVGDVIKLPVDVDSELALYVGGQKKWYGKVGTYKKRLIFKVTRPAKQANA